MCKGCLLLFLIFIFSTLAYGQKFSVDISSLTRFDVANREITINSNGANKPIVFLNSKPNQGVSWLKFAYHGLNDSTFDAIYFRPFNFRSTNKNSKNHCVEYISMPKYDWFNLRHLFKDEFESGLNVMIDPDSWIHTKIEITEKSVSVFVAGNPTPTLVVKPLNKIDKGRVGFWVGNGSDGSFSNLTIDETVPVK